MCQRFIPTLLTDIRTDPRISGQSFFGQIYRTLAESVSVLEGAADSKFVNSTTHVRLHLRAKQQSNHRSWTRNRMMINASKQKLFQLEEV